MTPHPAARSLADQVHAATADTANTFDRLRLGLRTINPERGWSEQVSDPATPRQSAHIAAAILGCTPCHHLRTGGPRPSIAALALHRIVCFRCAHTFRKPPAEEDDRCDWCGARGIETFHAFGVWAGPVLVIGDACHDCHAVLLGVEVDA